MSVGLQAAAPSQSNSRRLTLILAWGICVAVIIAFSPALNNQFISWDDDPNFLSNQHWRGLGWTQIKWMFTAFHMGHYQPITWLTLGFDYVCWGMDPRGYHLTNIILHSLNAALVFVLALRLLSWTFAGHARDRSMSLQLGAAAAALLFGIHPLRVESVAWITERRDLVGGFLLLSTTLAYLRSFDSLSPIRSMVAVLGLYVLALMAKVSAVPLVVVLLVVDWYPLRRSVQNPVVWLEKIPFAIAALVFSMVAVVGQSHNQTLTTIARHPLAGRIAQSFYGLVFYLEKTIVPITLLPLYELHLPIHWEDSKFVISAIAVTGIAVLIACLRKRVPGMMAVMLCYAVLLGPVLGLVQTGPQLVADRYSYLPSMVFMIGLAGGVNSLWRRMNSPVFGASMMAMAMLGAVALGILTWRQCAVWRSTESFWTYMINHDPKSAYANNGYGWLLLKGGHASESISYFRNSTELNPWYENGFLNLWDALKQTGAADELERSIELATSSPNLYIRTDAFAQRGFLAVDQDHPAQALADFQAALLITPDDPEALRGMAMAREKLQNSPDQPAQP